MNIWEHKEFELSQKHAEILKIRETILRGTERYYDSQNAKPSSFVTDFKKAKERNLLLLNDISRVSQILQDVSNEDALSQKNFTTLKANYWGMIRNSFPVWLEEQCEYEKSHGLPLSSRSTGHDPNLAQPSPRAGSPSLDQRSRPGSRMSNTGGDTTRTIPPLELDFSMGEDLTLSQVPTLRATTETTPKSALSSSGKIKNTNKKVQIKEDKKLKDSEKKERERLRKEAEKRRKDQEKEKKLREKEEKNRKKEEEKERKKSARTPRNK